MAIRSYNHIPCPIFTQGHFFNHFKTGEKNTEMLSRQIRINLFLNMYN